MPLSWCVRFGSLCDPRLLASTKQHTLAFFSMVAFEISQVVLPYPFEKINEVAEEVYRIYLECSPPEHSIQVKSIDEAYFRIPFEGPDHRRRNGSRRSLAVGSGAGFASRHSRISSSADLILNDDHGGDADGTQLSGNSEHWNSGNEAADLDSGSDDDSPTAQATYGSVSMKILTFRCTATQFACVH